MVASSSPVCASMWVTVPESLPQEPRKRRQASVADKVVGAGAGRPCAAFGEQPTEVAAMADAVCALPGDR
jgi:hypothetical protein